MIRKTPIGLTSLKIEQITMNDIDNIERGNIPKDKAFWSNLILSVIQKFGYQVKNQIEQAFEEQIEAV